MAELTIEFKVKKTLVYYLVFFLGRRIRYEILKKMFGRCELVKIYQGNKKVSSVNLEDLK